MLVVLDTNIVVSALLFGGVPREVLRLCIRGEPRLLTTDALLTELSEVLSRPRFGLSGEVVRGMLGEIVSMAEIVEITAEVTAIPDDPADNAVLACAVEGRADHIVSGDRHLLDLGAYQGIPVLTGRKYLDTVRRQEE